MSRLIIDHLSDLHVGALHYAETRIPVAQRQRVHEPRNLVQYRTHLQSLCRSNNLSRLPDLIVMSGDLTSYAAEDEIRTIKKEVLALVSILKKKETVWRKDKLLPYVLIVPGNHDLDWSSEGYDEKIKRYSELASDLHRNGEILSAVYGSTTPKALHYCDFGDECNLFIYLFNTTSLGGSLDPGLEKIYAKFKEIYQSLMNVPDGSTEALKDLKRLARQDPGYVADSDLTNMDNILMDVPKHRLKIGIMHHNPCSVSSDEIESFDTIINAGYLKMNLTRTMFDIILHGHRHILN